MKKINTAPISGAAELLPGVQAEFDRLLSGIKDVYRAHGFQHIETPVIERTEILLAKAGGDTEKQIYKVVKTAEAADEADQALRFDHTVPLARYIVQHMNDLIFPFKVTQIGRNFRGERAQRGRFREFYQCDVDVIGRGELPIAYDAEVIATLIRALQTLPLPSLRVRISNRKLLRGLFEELSIDEKTGVEILAIIDHTEKVPAEVTHRALLELDIGGKKVARIEQFMQIRGSRTEIAEKIAALGINNETFLTGAQELDEILKELTERGFGEQIEADLLIVRGLDYYTGMVFETIVPEYREIGSICSGGRYENLAENYTDQAFPGVGGSIGLTRLFWILQNYDLIKAKDLRPVEIGIVPLSNAEKLAAEALAAELRTEGYSVDVVRTDKNLMRKMKYMAKNAKWTIVLGEEEVKTAKYRIKEMETGQEYDLAEWRVRKMAA